MSASRSVLAIVDLAAPWPWPWPWLAVRLHAGSGVRVGANYPRPTHPPYAPQRTGVARTRWRRAEWWRDHRSYVEASANTVWRLLQIPRPPVQVFRLDEKDSRIFGRCSAQVVGEPCAGVAGEPGGLGAWPALGTQKAADASKAFQMRQTHDFAPFRFADREQRLSTAVIQAEDDDVDLIAGLVRRIVDGTPLDAMGKIAEQAVRSKVAGPVTTDVLEVRSEDVPDEPALAALPQSGGVACMFQVRPDGTHDGVIKGHERFIDPEQSSIVLERVGLLGDEPAVFKNVERMGQVSGLTTEK